MVINRGPNGPLLSKAKCYKLKQVYKLEITLVFNIFYKMKELYFWAYIWQGRVLINSHTKIKTHVYCTHGSYISPKLT